MSRKAAGPGSHESAGRPRGTWFATLAALVTLAQACHRGESEQAAASGAAPAAPAAAASAEAKAEYHEETFDLTLRPVGALAAGTQGSVEIQLSAKAGYHCNDKYPYKFKVGDSSGMKFAAPVFTKDALTLEEKRATMKVDLTPETKGEQTIRGVFAFSLCSAERCLVEKRELEAKIPVI
jgi:hypothetical protein